MKRVIWFGCIIVIIGAFTLQCTKQEAPSDLFSISPENPQAGRPFTITYDSTKEPFASAAEIQMLVYEYTTGFPQAKSVGLESKKGRWTGTFTIGSESYGAAVKFKTGEDIDNNQNKGYFLLMHDDNGNPLAGAVAGKAEALGSWGEFIMDLDPGKEQALELFHQEFDLHPEMKAVFVRPYLSVLRGLKPEGWENIAKSFMEEISVADDLSENALSAMARIYRELKDTEKADELTQSAKQKYPAGTSAQSDKLMALRGAKSLDEKMEMFKSFNAEFPKSDYIGSAVSFVITDLLKEEKFEELIRFVEDNSDHVDGYVLNRVASQMLNRKKDLDQALTLIEKGIGAARGQIENPGDDKPKYFTLEEWRDQIEKYTLSGLYTTQGKILTQLGRKEEALTSFEEAVNLSQSSDPEINESYCKALLEASRHQTAYEKISEFVREGSGNVNLNEMLKTAYSEVKGSEEGFDAYLEGLDSEATEKMRLELAKKLIDMPAPDFSLEDLDGNVITSASLIGKTFVLDFWATWCGPCIASFPGMKTVLGKFNEDETVEFFFVNTWQQEEDKVKNARDYITKNEYPFHVLMDVEDKLVNDYKVSGIPTKFVVDKNGRIRFKSVGYGGNDLKLVKELTLMIEMVK